MGEDEISNFGPYVLESGGTYDIEDTTQGRSSLVSFSASDSSTGTTTTGTTTTGTTTTTTPTTTATTSTTTTATSSGSPVPPPGYVGVSIDGGVFATDSRSIELDLVWPAGATSALISNNGGFNSAGRTETVALAPEVPWTLEYTGSDRLPKTVYVRYLGAGIDTENFTDDIILDEETPSISEATLLPPTSSRSTQGLTARIRSYRLRVVAAENLSGISEVETSLERKNGLVTSLAHAGRQGLLKLDKVITVTGIAAPRYTRVRSAAGKWSRWLAITPQR